MIRFITNFLSWSFTAAIFIIGGALLRFSWGPIELPGVANEIATTVNEQLDDLRVDIGAATVEFDSGAHAVGLVLHKVTLRDADGGSLIEAPRAHIAFDLSAAAEGEPRIRKVTLTGIVAEAVRTHDGRFAIDIHSPGARSLSTPPSAVDPNSAAIAQQETSDAASDPAAQLLDLLANGDAPPILASLEEITISQSSVKLTDQPLKRVWRLQDGDITLKKAERGFELQAQGAIRTAEDAPLIPVSATARLLRGGARAEITVRIDGASLETFVAYYPALAPLSPVRGYIHGEATLQVDTRSGAISPIEGAVSLRKGFLRIAENQDAPIERAAMDLFIDASGADLRLNNISVDAGGLELKGVASVSLSRDRVSQELDKVLVVLRAQSGAFSSAELFDAPVELKRAVADLDLDLAQKSAKIRFEAGVSDLNFRGDGTIAFGDSIASSRYAVNAISTGRGIGFEEAIKLWPKTIAPGGRAWLSENILAGRLNAMKLRYVGGGGLEDDVTLDFSIINGRATFMEGQPPITQAAADVNVRMDELTLSLKTGEVRSEAGGPIDLTGSKFRIPDFEPDIPPGEIDLVAKGPAQTLLALLDRQPLGLVTAYGRDLSGLKGEFNATAALKLPLAKDLLVKNMDIEVSAKMAQAGFTSSELQGALTDAQIEFTATKEAMSVSGSGRFMRTPVRFAVREPIAADAPAGSARATFTVGGSQLRTLGLDTALIPSGTVEVGLERALDDNDAPVKVSLNATNAVLRIPQLGWRKRRGARARASAVIEPTASGGWRISKLAGKLNDLEVAGAAVIGANGALTRLDLTRLKIGARTDARLTLRRRGGKLRLSARGASLDLSAALNSAQAAPNEPSSPPPLDFDVRFDRVYVGRRATLQKLVLRGSRNAKALITGRMTARAGAAPVELTLDARRDGAQSFELISQRAGDLLRAIGGFGDVRGGAIAVRGEIKNDVIRGRIVARDIVVRDTPVLADILSVGTGIGIFDRLGSGGTTFSRVRVPFQITRSRITISDAAASGPSLGITLKGVVDRRRERLNLNGAVSPANLINGLIGDFPIVGDILTGGQGGGIVGFAFDITGPITKPNVAVNPLSVIGIGPFKALFSNSAEDTRPRRRSLQRSDD